MLFNFMMSFVIVGSISKPCIAYRLFNIGTMRSISTTKHQHLFDRENGGARSIVAKSMVISSLSIEKNDYTEDYIIPILDNKIPNKKVIDHHDFSLTNKFMNENSNSNNSISNSNNTPSSNIEQNKVRNSTIQEDNEEDDTTDNNHDDDNDDGINDNGDDGRKIFSLNDDKKTFKGDLSLRLKVRQHVNPLSSKYMKPMNEEKGWVSNAFANITQPFIVDIGCAKGSWVLKYGLENPCYNIIGLEIRKPVVELCLKRKERWNLKNVHFLSCNANIDLKQIFDDIISNGGIIDTVCVQFPDPHFKMKHKKRRVVNELLVNTIVDNININNKVFIQSDILDVMEDMVLNFCKNKTLEICSGYDINSLDTNISPHNVLTEREIATQNKGLPIYRMMYRKIT